MKICLYQTYLLLNNSFFLLGTENLLNLSAMVKLDENSTWYNDFRLSADSPCESTPTAYNFFIPHAKCRKLNIFFLVTRILNTTLQWEPQYCCGLDQSYRRMPTFFRQQRVPKRNQTHIHFLLQVSLPFQFRCSLPLY